MTRKTSFLGYPIEYENRIYNTNLQQSTTSNNDVRFTTSTIKS